MVVPPPRPSPAERRSIVRDGLGVGLATGLYGVSFGAIAVTTGFSVWQTCVLSLVMFTGASQFAFVGVVAGGASAWSAAVTAWLLGSRNTLYGMALAPKLSLPRPRRLVAAHVVIDESAAMALHRESTEAARVGFWSTGWSVFVFWNLATLLGALAGEVIGDPRTYGLDAAVGAAFLALLAPRLGSGRARTAALVAAALALVLVPVTSAGVPVLAAGAVALLGGLLSPASPEAERDRAPDDGEAH